MIPAAIRALRRRAGLTQEQLARRLSVSANAVRSWEQGTRKPGGPALLMLQIVAREASKT